MRLFVALDIDDAVRERITRFLEGVREFAPDARWVQPESLHVTLKFIGEQPEAKLERIKNALHGARCESTTMKFCGYGFFPTPGSARVFWIGIEADGNLAKLANLVEVGLQPFGVEKERHGFSPHLTLARAGSGAPQRRRGDYTNRSFQRLMDKLKSMPTPDFGTITAHEFFLYQSKLSSGGPKYIHLERFPLH